MESIRSSAMRRLRPAFTTVLLLGACGGPSDASGARAIERELVGGIRVGMTEREARFRAEKIAEGDVDCDDERGYCTLRRGGAWPGGVAWEIRDGRVATVTHDFADPSWGDSPDAVRSAVLSRVERLAGKGTVRPDSLVVWRDPGAGQIVILGCRIGNSTPCLLVVSDLPDED